MYITNTSENFIFGIFFQKWKIYSIHMLFSQCDRDSPLLRDGIYIFSSWIWAGLRLQQKWCYATSKAKSQNIFQPSSTCFLVLVEAYSWNSTIMLWGRQAVMKRSYIGILATTNWNPSQHWVPVLWGFKMIPVFNLWDTPANSEERDMLFILMQIFEWNM